MVHVLQGYCIVSTGIRISCHNVTSSNKKQLILATNGNATIKENLMNMFGAKQIQNLVEVISCDLEDVRRLGEEFAGVTESSFNMFRLSGYISRCNHGYGRSSTDRQFFFINKRPCDHSKLSKVVNEVYHMYNRHQYPCVVLCVVIQQESVDVNVTPDKRQIIVQQEKLLLAVVKATILKTLEPMAGQFDLNQTQPQCGGFVSSQALSTPRVEEIGGEREWLRSSHERDSTGEDEGPLGIVTRGEGGIAASRLSSLSKFSGLKRSFGYTSDAISHHQKQSKQDTNEPLSKQRKLFECGFASTADSPSVGEKTSKTDNTFDTSDSNHNSPDNHSNVSDNNNHSSDKNYSSSDNCSSGFVNRQNYSGDTGLPEVVATNGEETPTSAAAFFGFDSERPLEDRPDVSEGKCDVICMGEDTAERNKSTDQRSRAEFVSSCPSSCPIEQSVQVDLEGIRRRLSTIHSCPPQYTAPRRRLFKAKISPEGSQEAESELRREISKDMFARMKVIGQFNLGFIIASIENNLFIIDQHATDEKFNFERLQRETVLQHQKLIRPLDLELTVIQEMVVMENLNVFSANGFEFQIDKEAPPTERVKLIGRPVSKNWQFGPDDVSELVFLLSDSPGEMCRPSRVSAMFASRACRTSIMIGTALSKSEMKKLLHHMSTLDHPWNCPHGRPTMRHLVDLSMLNTSTAEGGKETEEGEEGTES
jgi:DNA mismatch repair protein PMS2